MCTEEKEFLHEAVSSILPIADEIVIVFDEKTTDTTKNIVKKIKDNNKDIEWKLIDRNWDTSTKQKQFLFEQATKDWVLFFDADEILDGYLELVKEKIIHVDSLNGKAISLRSHHFIYNLALEDASVEKHYHYARLIKNDKRNLKFSGINHAVIEGFEENEHWTVDDVRFFHMGYIKHLARIAEKYHRDSKIKQLHTQEFLDSWRDAHMFGTYPVKNFESKKIPKIILKKFGVEK